MNGLVSGSWYNHPGKAFTGQDSNVTIIYKLTLNVYSHLKVIKHYSQLILE